MFRRRRTEANGEQSPRELYDGLRGQALEIDPRRDGFEPTAELSRVWGALLETGYGTEVATLLSLSDGTTSLYTTTGFVIIGGGGHSQVVDATRQFLVAIEAALDELEPETTTTLPTDGQAVIRALTFDGRRTVEAPEDDFGYDRHPLSPVFHAGQAVITELRILTERREKN
ncbi:MAG TPA: hypothetical protein VHC43_05585 [Mycobacteriales bacterium]|nr:hypothetical protein [Mycobacteriales bacterium]